MARNLLLVVASLVFYAWGEGGYVLLMVLSVIFNYLVGLWITEAKAARLALALGVSGNLLALAYFKYWGFLFGVIAGPFGFDASAAAVPLPLGISFFTFQAISYLVDVYRKHAEAQRNPINVALYITLFPQLIAGPIVRYDSIAESIRSRRSTLEGVSSGVELFIIGLSKKMLLANPLGKAADAAFGLEAGVELPMGAAWLGVTAYALQIYFDFSGYTDMARGLGRFFGFEFPENFRFPYLSKSVTEFWRRWHISLSTWFRDYVYIPLGGNRVGKARGMLNLWIVFLLCGLWHGASWNFLAWGFAHGAWMTLERSPLRRLIDRLHPVMCWCVTVLFLLCSWTLFRAETIEQSLALYEAMFSFPTWQDPLPVVVSEVVDTRFWVTLAIAIFVAFDGHRLARSTWTALGLKNKSGWVLPGRFAGLVCLLALSFARLAADQYNPFIYFRF